MDVTGDELAGIVDLFGALSHEELLEALSELAFKQGDELDHEAMSAAIATAIAEYRLVADDEALLTVGPTAFPTLPDNAEDLPHILEYDRRSVDHDARATQVVEQLKQETAQVVDSEDSERAAELLDVSYDVETWAGTETSEIRSTLQSVLPENGVPQD